MILPLILPLSHTHSSSNKGRALETYCTTYIELERRRELPISFSAGDKESGQDLKFFIAVSPDSLNWWECRACWAFCLAGIFSILNYTSLLFSFKCTHQYFFPTFQACQELEYTQQISHCPFLSNSFRNWKCYVFFKIHKSLRYEKYPNFNKKKDNILKASDCLLPNDREWK